MATSTSQTTTLTRACEVPTKKFPDGRTGTLAGRKAHLRAGEDTCVECREAYRLYKSGRKIVREGCEKICEVPTEKHPGGRTGTVAGLRAHRLARETPCDECAAMSGGTSSDGELSPMLKAVLDAQPHVPRCGWQEDAECRGLPSSVFIRSAEEAERRVPVNPLALNTCARCSVQVDCATEHAFEEFDVWGGLTITGRRVLRKRIHDVGGN